MQTPRTAHRLAVTFIASFVALAGGTALAQSASAAEAPPNPVDRAVLDVFQAAWAMPEGYEYEFTPQERIEGFMGINDFPGGPFGSFPQPASSTDPATMPGFPGTGYWGMVSDVTGVNPRPAADESSEASREMYGSDQPVAPACDDPESCDVRAAGALTSARQ